MRRLGVVALFAVFTLAGCPEAEEQSETAAEQEIRDPGGDNFIPARPGEGSCPGGNPVVCVACTTGGDCVDSCNGMTFCKCMRPHVSPRKCRSSEAPFRGTEGRW